MRQQLGALNYGTDPSYFRGNIYSGQQTYSGNYVSGGGTPYNVVYVGVYAGEYIAASGPPTTYFGNYVSTATYLGGPEGFEPYFGTATYLGNYVGQPYVHW